MPKLAPLALALLVSAFSGASYAADFYVVVPVKGRTSTAVVTLNAYNVPGGTVGQAYTPFNFNSVLQVTGDANFTGSGVTWAVTAGALPSGLRLAADTGILSGTPTLAGTSSFTLTATYSGRAGSQSYQLPVVLVAASASPTSLTFDDTLVNTTAPSKSFTLTNTGTVALTLQAPQADSVFSIVSKTCGTSLVPSGACQVVVAGTPTAAQTFNGTLSLATTAGLFSIPLTVKGTQPAGGQTAYSNANSYSFTVPAGVTALHIVAVGGGGGGTVGYNGPASGGGGALAWVNNVPVTPGEILTVVVGGGAPSRDVNASGGHGGDSYVARGGTSFLVAGGGKSAIGTAASSTNYGAGGTFSIQAGLEGGGGNGGSGAKTYYARFTGGGGAGGYNGSGGRGGGTWNPSLTTMTAAGDGSGGAASGGSGQTNANLRGAGGGGTGLYGEGASGAAAVAPFSGQAGIGGSKSGSSGTDSGSLGGGGFPGGGAAAPLVASWGNGGANGAVRIIWGAGRAFPSTRTADE